MALGAALADIEAEEVTALERHHGLDHVMQRHEADAQRNLDPSPDRRFDIVKGDLDARDAARICAGLLHAASVAAPACDRQFQGSSSGSRLCGMAAMRARISASQAWGPIMTSTLTPPAGSPGAV